MSPEEAQRVIHQWVYFSVYQVANNRPILYDGCVQNICDDIFGPEWNHYTNEEQQVKRNIIWREYNRMFRDYLPMLQQFQHDTNSILRLDEATLTTLLRKPSKNTTSASKISATKTSDAFDEPAGDEPIDEEILQTDAAIERDNAARKNLDKYYEPCQQGRKDLVIRRAKEPEGNIGLFDFKSIPLNDDKRTKNCPKCGKAVTYNGIKRHYQITHEKDPRWVIYCPAPGCKYECWRGDATILAHMAYHHEDLHREIFGEEDVQKQAKARAKGNEGVRARARAKADSKAKGSKTAASESGEQMFEQIELAEGHLRGEALDHEDISDEDVYDEDMSDGDMPTQHVPNLYMPNPHVPDQRMPTQHMPSQHMSNPYVPSRYIPNQHMPNWYMPNQNVPRQPILNQNMPNQHVPNQHLPNQHIRYQHMLNQPMPNQPMPNQPMPNQPMPNQPMPNQPTPNQPMPNKHTINQYMPTGYTPNRGDVG